MEHIESKNIIERFYNVVLRPKDPDGTVNSVDPNQTALLWVCTVCTGLSVQILFTVYAF